MRVSLIRESVTHATGVGALVRKVAVGGVADAGAHGTRARVVITVTSAGQARARCLVVCAGQASRAGVHGLLRQTSTRTSAKDVRNGHTSS